MSREVVSKDIMKEALRKSMEIKLAAYEKKIEKEEDHIFSEEYRKHMDRMLQAGESKEENRTIRYRSKRKSLRLKIALVAAIIMLMGSMTVLAVEPIREKLYEMIEKIFPDHTDILFENTEGEKNEFETNGIYPRKLKKIPEGYEFVKEDDFSDIDILQFTQAYQNEKGENLIYDQIEISEFSDSGVSITSNGEPAKEVSVCGELAQEVIDDGGYRTIIYEKDGFVYLISGFLDEKELIECLEAAFTEE